MCAHIGQKRHIYPPSIFRLHFDSYTPPPFSAGWRWGGCYREKFFLILFFFVSPIRFLLVFYFFIFSDFRLDSCFDSVFQIILFNYFDSIKIRHLILDFIFQTLHRFDSLQVITRHSPSVSFYIHHVWISRFQTLNFDSFLLVEFYSHQFRLVSALPILLFISSACYKQTYMLIWVCFMLVLAILRLSDVFSFVLGVVYRLGLK